MGGEKEEVPCKTRLLFANKKFALGAMMGGEGGAVHNKILFCIKSMHHAF